MLSRNIIIYVHNKQAFDFPFKTINKSSFSFFTRIKMVTKDNYFRIFLNYLFLVSTPNRSMATLPSSVTSLSGIWSHSGYCQLLHPLLLPQVQSFLGYSHLPIIIDDSFSNYKVLNPSRSLCLADARGFPLCRCSHNCFDSLSMLWNGHVIRAEKLSLLSPDDPPNWPGNRIRRLLG